MPGFSFLMALLRLILAVAILARTRSVMFDCLIPFFFCQGFQLHLLFLLIFIFCRQIVQVLTSLIIDRFHSTILYVGYGWRFFGHPNGLFHLLQLDGVAGRGAHALAMRMRVAYPV